MTPRARPLIIGHRGSSAVAPENTLAAFTRAIADGADGLEFDVRLSGDGTPVVIHDATLDRTANKPGLVSDFTAAELGKIDIGSWFNEKYPQHARPEYAHETLPTLTQVFELTKDVELILYVELKCEKAQSRQIAAKVAQVINELSTNQKRQVVVESFDLNAIAGIKSLDPSIRTAALFEPQLGHPTTFVRRLKMLALAQDVGADELALHHSLVTERLVAKATHAGLPVVVWTVDKPTWIKRARDYGITALITNNPAALLAERSRPAVV
jgi:glycerophosphoryl diester phosphodiesterase